MKHHRARLFDLAWIAPIVIVIGWSAATLLTVETPVLPAMRTVDVFDTTSSLGMRWIVASVETNYLDSALIARYATMLYHRLIPKHLDDTGAVQMEVYVYNPEYRRSLSPDDVVRLTRHNPAAMNILPRLEIADSAYAVLRLSSPWMIMGRDTLTMAKTRIFVPKEGYRWASLVRRSTP